MRIHGKQALGLLIDMQDRLFPHIENHSLILYNTLKLIDGLKTLQVPIMVTQQYTKGLGETLVDITQKIDNFQYSEKISFSCCDEPLFYKKLSASGKKFIIIAGIETHVCLLQTVIDLLENDFIPVVLEDCTGSRNSNDKNIALKRMRQEGAVVSTCESVLFEITRFANTPTFKSISKIVK